MFVTVDTREVQPHDPSEKEQLGLASVKVEPGSTSATTTSSTGTRLLHGILSQHPQQHGLGLQNGYGRHLAGHAQMGQPPYTTAAIATTSTPGTPRKTPKAYQRDLIKMLMRLDCRGLSFIIVCGDRLASVTATLKRFR